MKRVLIVCTTDSMIWNFLVPHVKHMESLGMEVECACSISGVYFSELKEQQGLKMHEIHFHRSPYHYENIKAYKELRKLVVARNFDTIFCHEPVGGAMGRLVGARTNRNVIYMAHGFHFFRGAPKINWLIYYNVEKFLSKYTNTLLVINKEDYQAACKFKAKRVKLINGIGIDISKFCRYKSNYIREKFGLERDDIIMLTVGELIPRKNHETVIKMLASMRKDKLHLFIAGEGELSEKLKAEVDNLGISTNVHFLGFCRNISELCNSCDLFIFPSIHEGLSVALMEAMACGKPIVASKIRGNVDLIDEGKGGFLVEALDIKGYSNAVMRLIDNPEILRQFGDYNIEKVKQFDIDTVKTQLEQIYRM